MEQQDNARALFGPASSRQREKATVCSECGRTAVLFNPGNVDVACHHCGTRERDMDIRPFHLRVYLICAVEQWLEYGGGRTEE